MMEVLLLATCFFSPLIIMALGMVIIGIIIGIKGNEDEAE